MKTVYGILVLLLLAMLPQAKGAVIPSTTNGENGSAKVSQTETLGLSGGGVSLDAILVPGTTGLTLQQARDEFYNQQSNYSSYYLMNNSQLQSAYGLTWPNSMLAFSTEPRLTADAVVGYARAYRNETDPNRLATYSSMAGQGAEFLMCVQNKYAGTADSGAVLDDLGSDPVPDIVSTARSVVALWQCYQSFGSTKYFNAAMSGSNWLYSHPSYPYTYPGDPYKTYSNANYIGSELHALAMTYEFTGNQKWLDRSIQAAEELMAWQDFVDSRDTWGANNTPGGWYYYDYQPQPAPPAGTPVDADQTKTGYDQDKYMHYHTEVLDGLIEILQATGHQTLFGTTTIRDQTDFFDFKCKLINAIMRAVNFMIDNQEVTTNTSIGQLRGGLRDCNKGLIYGSSTTPSTNYRSDNSGLETLVNAYDALSLFSTVADAQLQKIMQLIDGYVQNMNHNVVGYHNAVWDDPEWFLKGSFRSWSAYLEFIANPVSSRNLSLVNSSFEDPKIQWELWSWDGGGVNVVGNVSRTGSHSVRVTDNSTSVSKWASLLLTAQQNTNYTLSAYAYMLSGDHMTLEIEFLDSNYQMLTYNTSYVYPNSGFQNVTVSATSPTNTKYLDIWLYSAIAFVSDGYWDDVSISQQPSGANSAIGNQGHDVTLSVFPNPSNPSPEIKYEIDKPGRVKVDVFDILGRHVATLVDAYEQAGEHSLHTYIPELSSGVYFCRIQTADYIKSQKFVILK